MNEAIDTVKAFVTALMAGDVDGAVERLDPDLTLHENTRLPYRGTYRGHEGFMQLLGKINEFWETIAVGEMKYVDDGDAVVVVGSMSGNVRSTGAAISVNVVERYLVHDGQIRELWPFYVDTHLTSEEIGTGSS